MTSVQVSGTHYPRALQRMSCSPKDLIEQLESVVALDAVTPQGASPRARS